LLIRMSLSLVFLGDAVFNDYWKIVTIFCLVGSEPAKSLDSN
jgi:hypothetical protein